MNALKVEPAGRAMLIGSQPLKEHSEAAELVFRYVPEIPNWAQLPCFEHEGMVAQFVSGMPGLVSEGERTYVNAAGDTLDEEMAAFFEEYLAVTGDDARLEKSRFALTPEIAAGFFELTASLANPSGSLFAVKGQVTGPITFCTSLTDQDRRAVFYNDSLRDAAVKMLALKAAWQVQRLGTAGVPTIIFIDEPVLASYGSSELISISREDIIGCLEEVIDAIHQHGGLAGVHVCANTDWSLLLDSNVDVINFDAYGYFEKFILYGEKIDRFLKNGGCLAWGIVPTSQADQVEAATLDTLWSLWRRCIQQMADQGIDPELVRRQSFITPSCGTGSLTPELSQRVLELTKALSEKVRG